jgi:hypothetical protein
VLAAAESEKAMNCPFLDGSGNGSFRELFICNARGSVYLPGVSELGKYCTQRLHVCCPVYPKRPASRNADHKQSPLNTPDTAS